MKASELCRSKLDSNFDCQVFTQKIQISPIKKLQKISKFILSCKQSVDDLICKNRNVNGSSQEEKKSTEYEVNF